MTAIVKSIFLSWIEKREKSAEKTQDIDDELEESLLAVSRFVQDIALEGDDMELLGFDLSPRFKTMTLMRFSINYP